VNSPGPYAGQTVGLRDLRHPAKRLISSRQFSPQPRS
jgi:hypothetical protein